MGCAIRNRIRDLRAASGDMTQQALADRIGVTRQTVNAIELGKVLAVVGGGVPYRARLQHANR